MNLIIPFSDQIELEAAKTLLLIIDMENENAHPDGPLFIGEPVKKIIPKIAELEREFGRLAGESYILSPFALAMHLNLPCSKIPYANSKALGQLNGLMN